MSNKERIKEVADEIAFRLLATNKTVDQPWLEKKLKQLCKDCNNDTRLKRSSDGIFGVCEGLGNWTNLNPWIYRIAFLLTFSQSWVLYVILALCMKDE